MKSNPFSATWKDHFNRNVLVVTLVMLALLIAFIYWQMVVLPPELPLYFSLANPAEQLASRSDLIGLPIVIGGIVIGNIILSIMFYRSQRLLSKILLVVGGLVVILMFITLINITLLIT